MLKGMPSTLLPWQASCCRKPDCSTHIREPAGRVITQLSGAPEESHEPWQDCFARIDGAPGGGVRPRKGQQHVPHGWVHHSILLVNGAQDQGRQLRNIRALQGVWRSTSTAVPLKSSTMDPAIGAHGSF